MKTRTFIFLHKNKTTVLAISTISFEEAKKSIKELVKNVLDWYCKNKKGEIE